MNSKSTQEPLSAVAPVDNGALDMNWAFEHSPDCIKVMTIEGALHAMNRNGQCAMEIDDFTTVYGNMWDKLWPDEARERVRGAMASARNGGEGHFNAFCPTAKGTPKWWDVLVSPIRDTAGLVAGLLAVSRDISELRRAVDQQRELSARLQSTLDVAEFGEWDLDLNTLEARCTLRHDQCFGYNTPVADWNVDKLISHIHPADRERVGAVLQSIRDGGTTMRFEARVIWPDDSVHWISVHGSVYAGSGKADRVIGLVSDITERMRVTEALEDASRNKDQFLAMLAHELRNPLAPISAAAKVLAMGRASPAQTLKAGAIIDRQASHMNRLLDDLLDVSRVTQGLVTLASAPVDLKRVATDAVEQARPLIEERAHQLTMQIDPAPAFVLGDDKRLVQVVANLLNNAAKYTPRGGQIVLRLGSDDTHVRVSVGDNGIGMAPAVLEDAFELFSQAARSVDRSTGGLGLGLALVKSLVERHAGTVEGHSAGPHCGSEFVVTLPLLALASDAQAVTDLPVPPQAARLRLLIVDDNQDAAEMLAMFLDAVGHETHVAFSGHEALARAVAVRPDACLLDVGLPDMSGHELVKRLHALPEAHGAAMIAITGYGSALDRERSATAGFHHHLTKPVDTVQLNQLLARLPAAPAN